MLKAISVFTAIFCGVLIGALIGSAIETSLAFGNYLWAAGALAGGLFAYCLVGFGQFKTGVAKAWVATETKSKAAFEKVTGWRPYKPYWIAVGTFQIAGCALLGSVLLYCLPGFMLTNSILHWMDGAWVGPVLYVPGVLITGALMSVFLFGGFLAALFGIILMVGSPIADLQCMRDDTVYLKHLERERRAAQGLIETTNPFAVAKLVLKHLKDAPRYAKTAGVLLWLGLRSAGWFAGYTVAFVHSQARVICLVDTALFVIVAHFLGFTLQGNLLAATAGGVFGVVNYFVVGVWWLKLTPAKAMAN